MVYQKVFDLLYLYRMITTPFKKLKMHFIIASILYVPFFSKIALFLELIL